MKIEITKSLYDFLKEKGVLDQFCINTLKNFSDTLTNEVSVELDDAFSWLDAPEGFNFWRELSIDFDDWDMSNDEDDDTIKLGYQ